MAHAAHAPPHLHGLPPRHALLIPLPKRPPSVVAPRGIFPRRSNIIFLFVFWRGHFSRAKPCSRRSATRGATTTSSSGGPVAQGHSPARRAPPRTSSRTGARARRLDAARGGEQAGGVGHPPNGGLAKSEDVFFREIINFFNITYNSGQMAS